MKHARSGDWVSPHLPDHATFPTMTVRENIQVALLSFRRQLFNLWSSTPRFARAEPVAARTGRHERLRRTTLRRTRLWRPQTAGTRDRARQSPKLLLMDEPTAAWRRASASN